MIMAILLPILIRCTVGIMCNKSNCDITVVATRVTKEKQSGHMTPQDVHML